ncbi:Deaminated glutathione amidase [Pleomorphomonas sp. T1.2MG-36]|uniref:carbon-nitrogen hydrolase family protein n=1 Tax=Pleomorphomonas sp. T1.2MG-36 TaxID=3041167 RepID=UPI0024778BB8|nr:carbon-nitrogen hydrolase family protein [Pleomorphomonas sp. T1.2MG-36]CAI9413116.1 Deaminated glutathione amidase [Pleomorphomonas sp. T1.2MG-36]
MTRPLCVAAVQLRSGRDPSKNLPEVEALVRDAAAAGATYVQTPEMTNIIERDRADMLGKLEIEAKDAFVARGAELARELGITLHFGSLAIRRDDGKIANRAYVFGPAGDLLARYDKIHMFDVDLPMGETWRESAAYTPGESAIVVNAAGTRIGLAICYDLRFPQLFRAYGHSEVEIMGAPAAFTRQTGEAHWHVLQRARAIENGCFMVSAAQGGTHEDGRETYGHSLIVGPWGKVIAEADHANPGVVVADIDLDEVELTRARIPSLENERRFTLAE